MGYSGNSFLVSSHIPQIIPKGKLVLMPCTRFTDRVSRVLLACIKFLSQNPCPRCLTLKTDIIWLGTKLDRRRREKGMRIDNDIQKGKIERVREWIFKSGFSLLSKYISRLLGPESLVPTRVCTIMISTLFHPA